MQVESPTEQIANSAVGKREWELRQPEVITPENEDRRTRNQVVPGIIPPTDRELNGQRDNIVYGVIPTMDREFSSQKAEFGSTCERWGK